MKYKSYRKGLSIHFGYRTHNWSFDRMFYSGFDGCFNIGMFPQRIDEY